MPAYDYHCTANGRTVEVSHSMTAALHTWGQLCDLTDVETGDTARDAPLRRVFSAPLLGGVQTTEPAAPAANVPCSPGGCPCCS